MNKSKGLLILLVLGVISSSLGHNWFSNPVSRKDQKDTQTGCRYGNSAKRSEHDTRQAPTCSGPCDDKVANIQSSRLQTAARGQSVTLNWNTHNHPGGFVRFAWSQTSQSDSHSSFDSQVDRYVCKEIGGCSVTGSTAAGFSNAPTGVAECGISYTIPDWLSDGRWTLQWAYFGGWLNAGDYYACVDYQITGGTTLGAQTTPTFQGGDHTYPADNKCRFYTTQALHTCTYEPCDNGTLGTAGMESSGPPKLFTSSRTLVDISTNGALPSSPPSSTPTPPPTPGPTPSPFVPTPTPTPTPTPNTPTPLPTPTSQNGSDITSQDASRIPCTTDADCASGVCKIDNFCKPSSGSSLDAGSIAAIVFAALLAVLIAGLALFFYVNKSEVPYMVPFKGRV